MAKGTRGRFTPPTTGSGSVRQMRSDLQLDVSVDYERGLRALWLLDLHRTPSATLSFFQGEDCKHTDEYGNITFRQIKKRDTPRPWTFHDLKVFIENALNKMSMDDHVAFEFFTNAYVDPELVEINEGRETLSAQHQQVIKLLNGRDSQLCSRLRFVARHEATRTGHFHARIQDKLVEMLAADNPDTDPYFFINLGEIRDITGRLISAIPKLASMPRVRWDDVDRCLEYPRYLETLRARLIGGQALLSITGIDNLLTRLPSDAAHALTAVRTGRSIPREPAESQILGDLKTWSKNAARPSVRGTIILGVHGSGRTHLLMRLLHQLSQEPHLQVCIASTLAPDPNALLPMLAREREQPLVILVDDASEEWINILSMPSGYFSNMYFVTTLARPNNHDDRDSLTWLRNQDVMPVLLPSSPSSEEFAALAGILRTVHPSGSEWRAAMRTNLRGALQIISDGDPDAPRRPRRKLQPQHTGLLMPILVCGILDVPIPRGIIQRQHGGALPEDLEAYIVPLVRRGAALIAYESIDTANELLVRYLGLSTGINSTIRDHCGLLLDAVDPSSEEERRFARHLVRALWSMDRAEAASLLRVQKRNLLKIITAESIYALAFAWLPMLNEADTQLLDACFQRLGESPATAADFTLFMRYYGIPEAAKWLGRELRNRTTWDGWLLAEMSKMIVRLPTAERREVSRMFTQLIFDLPPRLFFESLSNQNSLTTITGLLAEHGLAADRVRAVNLMNEFFLFRTRDSLPLTANWIESHLRLCERTLRQSRNRLSLRIARQIVDWQPQDGAPSLTSLEDEYHKLQQNEARAKMDGVLETALRLFDDVSSFRSLLGEVNVPSNLLRVVSTWGTDADKLRVSASFVDYIDAIAPRVPLDRMAALLGSGLRLVRGSSSTEVRRRFVVAVLPWLLQSRTGSDATATLALYVLNEGIRGVFNDEGIRGSCHELVSRGLFLEDSGLAEWNEILSRICKLVEMTFTPTNQAPWPALREWTGSALLTQYLRLARSLSDAEANFTSRLWARWKGEPWPGSFELALAISSHGMVAAAADLIGDKTANPETRITALCGMAIIELRRDRAAAYEAFRRSLDAVDAEPDRAGYRATPRLARLVQLEFSRRGEAQLEPLHRMCGELLYDGRLPHLERSNAETLSTKR